MTKNKKKSTKPLLSVIVPVYNGEETIDRCLKSILVGNESNLEIICVNDGSTDRTKDILNRYVSENPGIISIVEHSHNKGLFSARISGIKASTGKLIGFVDADDYVGERYFDRLCSAFSDNKIDIAVGTIVNESSDGKKYIQSLCEKFPYCENDNNESVYELFWKQAGRCYHWHVVWNKVYKRGLWEKNLEFFEKNETNLVMTEDFIFSSVILRKVRNYSVELNARYYYVDNSKASTKLLDESLVIKSKISDMKNAFDIVKIFLERRHSTKKFLAYLEEWRQRYARIWKHNVNNSFLSNEEKKDCVHMLENWAGKVIENVSEYDEHYYSYAKYLNN